MIATRATASCLDNSCAGQIHQRGTPRSGKQDEHEDRRPLRCLDYRGRAGRTLVGPAVAAQLRQESAPRREAVANPAPPPESRRGHGAVERLLLLESARPRRTPSARALHEIQPALLLEDSRAREPQLRGLQPSLHPPTLKHRQLSTRPQ